MTTHWKTLEDHVLSIASIRWNAACKPEHINGVDFDAVVRPSSDEIILIEITTERDLGKVRADINKIMPTRIRLATEGMICRGFVVIADAPTNSMTEAGHAAHIKVCSITEFERDFFDFQGYLTLRNRAQFGSAIDAKTGENDTRPFIEVKYTPEKGKNSLGAREIAEKLTKGERIVLTGDYGTGKSRCIKEVFTHLSTLTKEAGAYPIAINLREHWSSSSAAEIIAGHLSSVGLSGSIDNIIRLLNSGHLILLLDGFDEVGAQTHELRVEDRTGIRRSALKGVKDLIQRCKAGVIISGRSHFFDGDEEMILSLGLGNYGPHPEIVNAPELFSIAESQNYLLELGVQVEVPAWLPRKPLVFQILATLPKQEVAKLLEKEFGEFQFWALFLRAVCKRESEGVKNSIPATTIRAILLALAAKSRYTDSFLGRFSPGDLNDAYERAVGSAPDETGRQLLSRMCTLGRIEPESPDRQFIDHSMADILRAEKLVNDIVVMHGGTPYKQWIQSSRPMGAIHAANIIKFNDLEQQCFAFLAKFGEIKNFKKLSEVVSILSISGSEKMDFKSINIIGGEFPILRFDGAEVVNLSIRKSVIEILILDNSIINEAHNVQIEGCLLGKVAGVSSALGLPSWVKDSEVIEFDRVTNASRIKDSFLAPSQKLFLSIIQKIFFQPGGGREESALLKGGYGQKFSPKLVGKILKLLQQEGVIEKFKGQNGDAYRPVRRYTERMDRIRAELTLSDDQIWKSVSELTD